MNKMQLEGNYQGRQKPECLEAEMFIEEVGIKYDRQL